MVVAAAAAAVVVVVVCGGAVVSKSCFGDCIWFEESLVLESIGFIYPSCRRDANTSVAVPFEKKNPNKCGVRI